MKKCLWSVDEHHRKIYLEFYLETNTICHQLQSHAFRHETERLVNGLTRSDEFVERKLDRVEEKSELLLRNSNQIYKSLSSIDIRTRKLVQSSEDVETHIDKVMKNYQEIYEESKGITNSQRELQESQMKMRERLEEGIAIIRESYDNLVQGINSLKNEGIEMENKIGVVGEVISFKMDNLIDKADDIGNMTEISVCNQKEILGRHSVTLEGLEILTKFQSYASEESRDILQRFAEFGRKQQEELLEWHKDLQRAHVKLAENSRSIINAQESFESKQEITFVALDKLFILHDTMLLESRLIKAFFVYSVAICALHVFTDTKQTYAVRSRLYIALFATMLIECAIIQFANNGIQKQSQIINFVRTIFMLIASTQLLYAVYSYRDYRSLSHNMLLMLTEKVNSMQRRKELQKLRETDNGDDN